MQQVRMVLPSVQVNRQESSEHLHQQQHLCMMLHNAQRRLHLHNPSLHSQVTLMVVPRV
jgi:hypothetical protein